MKHRQTNHSSVLSLLNFDFKINNREIQSNLNKAAKGKKDCRLVAKLRRKELPARDRLEQELRRRVMKKKEERVYIIIIIY